jgi:hypothetical protein
MLIGLIGYSRSGKDSFADFMVQDYDFVKLAFADPMREALTKLNPVINLGGHYAHLGDAVSRMGWEAVKSMSPDVRGLLQRMGTEVGREMFGEDVWVNMAMQKAADYPDVVFSDVRFLNEANAITEAGGTIIRIRRSGTEPINSHRSETELDTYNAEYTVGNSQSLDDLHVKVNVLMSSLKAWA